MFNAEGRQLNPAQGAIDWLPSVPDSALKSPDVWPRESSETQPPPKSKPHYETIRQRSGIFKEASTDRPSFGHLSRPLPR